MSGMPSSRRNDGLLVAFLVLTAVCLAAMAFVPGQVTLPYHILFLTLTLVYGYALWPARRTIGLLLLVTVTTGFVLIRLALDGQIEWEECTEIVLMPAIFLGMLWHSQRQLQARERMATEASTQRTLLDHERQFIQDSSHAIRTPVTVARGHLDLAMTRVDDPQAREDLEVVALQLDRIAKLAATLMAIKELSSPIEHQRHTVDVADLVAQSARRWSKTADRMWQIDAPPGAVAVVDEHVLSLALDALLENAVRFTLDGDPIRVAVRWVNGQVEIEVADGGPGIPYAERQLVFDRFWQGLHGGTGQGSGLGLALVRAVAVDHGGSVSVADSELGGASITLTLPTPTLPTLTDAERLELDGSSESV